MDKKAPKELLETRPGLAMEDVEHPANGAPLGPPPRKYTPGLHREICRLIEEGNRPPVAAGIAGITANTFHEWMRRGKEGDPHLWEFAQDVELAEAKAEGHAVATVKKHMLNDPETAQWWLERARAKGWSKQTKTVVQSEMEDLLARVEVALAAGCVIDSYEKFLALCVGELGGPAVGPNPGEQERRSIN